MLWKPQKVEGWGLGREQVKGLFHFPSFRRLIQGMEIAHTGGLCWEGLTASKDGHSLGTGRCSGAPAEFPTNLCIWFLEWSRLLYLTPLFPYRSPSFKVQGLIPLVPKGHMLVREDQSELGEEPWEKGRGEGVCWSLVSKTYVSLLLSCQSSQNLFSNPVSWLSLFSMHVILCWPKVCFLAIWDTQFYLNAIT